MSDLSARLPRPQVFTALRGNVVGCSDRHGVLEWNFVVSKNNQEVMLRKRSARHRVGCQFEDEPVSIFEGDGWSNASACQADEGGHALPWTRCGVCALLRHMSQHNGRTAFSGLKAPRFSFEGAEPLKLGSAGAEQSLTGKPPAYTQSLDLFHRCAKLMVEKRCARGLPFLDPRSIKPHSIRHGAVHNFKRRKVSPMSAALHVRMSLQTFERIYGTEYGVDVGEEITGAQVGCAFSSPEALSRSMSTYGCEATPQTIAVRATSTARVRAPRSSS